jgi:hypothetical protein
MLAKLGAVGLAFYQVLAEMSPYLLFGFFVAGLLSVFVSAETVERHLGGDSFLSVLKAAMFGVPLPLCSCGVIPVAASLRRSGASRGATTSFLLSTPQTGVDSILVTYSLLGWVFAVFRPLAALVTGLVGGSLVTWLDREDAPKAAPAPTCAGDTRGCQGSCATEGKERGRLYRVFHYGFIVLPGDIARALVIGLIVAGIISAAMPEDFFASRLDNQFLQILLMMAIGLPIYVCATASVPVAAALMMKGISPGAALAFLMTGPATNAATISTIYSIMGKRTAIIYLATVATLAVLFGLLLNFIYTAGDMTHMHHAHWMLPAAVNHVAAATMLGVLAFALLKSRPKLTLVAELGDETVTIAISGMRCAQCSLAVEKALGGCAGVERAVVDLKRGVATVSGREFKVESLCQAIRELGYKPGQVEGLKPGSCDEFEKETTATRPTD